MYKSLFKYSFIVCAVLSLGQLQYKERALGDYFISGTKALGMWGASEIASNPWVEKLLHPKALSQWFPLGDIKNKKNLVKEKIQAKLSPHEELDLDSEEEENLEELNDENELGDQLSSSEEESQLDDSAVMAIIQ